MCMNNVDFALTYDKGCRDFIGYGYKNLSDSKAKTYKRKWVEATGNYNGNVNELKTSKMHSSSGKPYPIGFHIFLNKEDAKSYGFQNVIKVKFRGVLAFGKNQNNPFNSKYGPCVIARYMKFVEEVNNGVTAKAA